MNPPKSPNYCATVVAIRALTKLPNSDFLQGVPLFGLQAIVGLDAKVGDIGIVFPSECQLSTEYSTYNNLYRHNTLNRDPDAKGYLEDNRRIRAIRLRGNRSDALFMPLESLAFTGYDISSLKEGDEFDELLGHEICRKYEIERKAGTSAAGQVKNTRIDQRLFPQQTDVSHWFRQEKTISEDAWLTVTQKLHGANIRVGHIPVARKLSLLERIADRLGIKVSKYEYSMVYGSHKVIKDSNNPDQRHFYDSDIWSQAGHRLDGLLPENYIVFGEIVGYTESGQSIQKHYTYGEKDKQNHIYIYRVTIINNQGIACDLSWDAVKEFCISRGLDNVPELWRGKKSDFDANLFLDIKFREDGYSQAVLLSNDSPVDEGIVVRIEGSNPTILKAKSPVFLGHETRMIDEEAVDIEATQ